MTLGTLLVPLPDDETEDVVVNAPNNEVVVKAPPVVPTGDPQAPTVAPTGDHQAPTVASPCDPETPMVASPGDPQEPTDYPPINSDAPIWVAIPGHARTYRA